MLGCCAVGNCGTICCMRRRQRCPRRSARSATAQTRPASRFGRRTSCNGARYSMQRHRSGWRRARQVFATMDCRLLAGDGEADHLHILVEYPPKLSVSMLVNAFKGTSSRMPRRNRPDIASRYRDRILWSPAYFAASGRQTGPIFRHMNKLAHIISCIFDKDDCANDVAGTRNSIQYQ